MGNTGEQLLSVPLSLSVYINDHIKWASPEEGLVFTLLDVIEFRFHFTLHSISSLGLQISFHKKFRGTSRDCDTFERLFVPHHLLNAIWFHHVSSIPKKANICGTSEIQSLQSIIKSIFWNIQLPNVSRLGCG